MWPFTITYIRAVTFHNCWRQVLHINTKYSSSLIIYWNKFYSDTINELLIDAFKENSSEQKLLSFSFPAWVLG
jgi:hypothetical protein